MQDFVTNLGGLIQEKIICWRIRAVLTHKTHTLQCEVPKPSQSCHVSITFNISTVNFLKYDPSSPMIKICVQNLQKLRSLKLLGASSGCIYEC